MPNEEREQADTFRTLRPESAQSRSDHTDPVASQKKEPPTIGGESPSTDTARGASLGGRTEPDLGDDASATQPGVGLDFEAILRRLIALDLVTPEEWNAAATDSNNNVIAVLTKLRSTPGRWAAFKGKPLPVLTQYQVDQILAEHTGSLRLAHYVLVNKL